MIKIVFICGPYTDGKNNTGYSFIHSQAKALKKSGIDVCILSVDSRSLRKRRKFGIFKCELDGIPVFVGSFPSVPINGFLEKSVQIIADLVFKKIVKDFGMPDIVHGHFYRNANAGLNFCKKNNIPLVVTEHASWILSENRNKFDTKFAKKVYENCDKVLCVSKLLKQSIEEFYNKDVKIVPNIVSDNFFNLKNVKTDDVFRFISIGNLIETKRFDLTIKAFHKFLQLHENTELVIIGKGILSEKLKDLTISLKIEDKVIFKGFIPNNNLHLEYQQASCFVLPSNFETFGVVYIEALASGLPVIAIKNAEKNGIVSEKEGFVLKENSVDEVFNGMISIFENYEKYSKELISKAIKDRYSEKVVAEKLIQIYEELN